MHKRYYFRAWIYPSGDFQLIDDFKEVRANLTAPSENEARRTLIERSLRNGDCVRKIVLDKVKTV